MGTATDSEGGNSGQEEPDKSCCFSHSYFEICRRAVKEFTVVLLPMIMGNNFLEDSDFFFDNRSPSPPKIS